MAFNIEHTKATYGGPAEQVSSEATEVAGARCDAIAISVAEFCRLTSLGRTTAFQLIRDNRLEIRRIGGRTLILTRSIEALLDLDAVDLRS